MNIFQSPWNPLNWFFTVENYGRFMVLEAMLAWMLSAAALTYIVAAIAYISSDGFPGIFNIAVLLSLAAFFIWSLPLIIIGTADLRDIARERDTLAPAPTSLIIAISVLSVFIGTITTLILNIYMPALAETYGSFTAYVSFIALFLSIWVMTSWFVAWFIVYPDHYYEDWES